MTYLFWLLVFLWGPQLVLFLFYGPMLWRYRKTLILCMISALIFSVPWDWWAISSGTWMFPAGGNLGVRIGASPLEEYLFIIFATLFMSSITLVLRNLLGSRLAV